MLRGGFVVRVGERGTYVVLEKYAFQGDFKVGISSIVGGKSFAKVASTSFRGSLLM